MKRRWRLTHQLICWLTGDTTVNRQMFMCKLKYLQYGTFRSLTSKLLAVEHIKQCGWRRTAQHHRLTQWNCFYWTVSWVLLFAPVPASSSSIFCQILLNRAHSLLLCLTRDGISFDLNLMQSFNKSHLNIFFRIQEKLVAHSYQFEISTTKTWWDFYCKILM